MKVLSQVDSLKGDIVNRGDAGRRLAPPELHVSCRQSGLPVVQMNDIRLPAVAALHGNARGNATEGAVAQMIVRPVLAVGAEVGVARSVIEMRRVQGDERKPGRLAGDQLPAAAKGARKLPQHLGLR